MGRMIRRRAPAVVFSLMLLFVGVYGASTSVVTNVALGRVAATYVAGECTITDVEVDGKPGSDGERVYAPRARYRLVVSGTTYVGERVTLAPSWSSDRSEAEAVVAAHSVGTRWPCWYDPASPSEVVLDRSVARVPAVSLMFMGLAIGGLGLLIHALRRPGASRLGLAVREPGARGPMVLSTRRAEALELLLSAGSALAVGVIGGAAVTGAWTHGSTSSWLAGLLFGGLAVGVGVWFVRCLLRVLGPRVWLRLAAPTVRLGESVRLEYALRGPRLALHGELTLVGREETSHLVRERAVTETHEFYKQTVVGLDSGARSGVVTVSVPRGTMHSLYAQHNRIVWALAVEARVGPRWWPDVKEQYVIAVEPAEEVET